MDAPPHPKWLQPGKKENRLQNHPPKQIATRVGNNELDLVVSWLHRENYSKPNKLMLDMQQESKPCMGKSQFYLGYFVSLQTCQELHKTFGNCSFLGVNRLFSGQGKDVCTSSRNSLRLEGQKHPQPLRYRTQGNHHRLAGCGTSNLK